MENLTFDTLAGLDVAYNKVIYQAFRVWNIFKSPIKKRQFVSGIIEATNKLRLTEREKVLKNKYLTAEQKEILLRFQQLKRLNNKQLFKAFITFLDWHYMEDVLKVSEAVGIVALDQEWDPFRIENPRGLIYQLNLVGYSDWLDRKFAEPKKWLTYLLAFFDLMGNLEGNLKTLQEKLTKFEIANYLSWTGKGTHWENFYVYVINRLGRFFGINPEGIFKVLATYRLLEFVRIKTSLKFEEVKNLLEEELFEKGLAYAEAGKVNLYSEKMLETIKTSVPSLVETFAEMVEEKRKEIEKRVPFRLSSFYLPSPF
jgi:hypothetical protein